jgi:hypothetical protein
MNMFLNKMNFYGALEMWQQKYGQLDKVIDHQLPNIFEFWHGMKFKSIMSKVFNPKLLWELLVRWAPTMHMGLSLKCFFEILGAFLGMEPI